MRKAEAKTSDEGSAESDKVTAELQQLADENAALKKLLELVGTALPAKAGVKSAKAGVVSAKAGVVSAKDGVVSAKAGVVSAKAGEIRQTGKIENE